MPRTGESIQRVEVQSGGGGWMKEGKSCLVKTSIQHEMIKNAMLMSRTEGRAVLFDIIVSSGVRL